MADRETAGTMKILMVNKFLYPGIKITGWYSVLDTIRLCIVRYYVCESDIRFSTLIFHLILLTSFLTIIVSHKIYFHIW